MRNAMTEIVCISFLVFPKIGCISYSRFPKIGSIPSHVFQQSVRFSANNRFCKIGYYPNHYYLAICKGVVIKVGQIIDLFNPNNNKYAPIGDMHVQ